VIYTFDDAYACKQGLGFQLDSAKLIRQIAFGEYWSVGAKPGRQFPRDFAGFDWGDCVFSAPKSTRIGEVSEN